MQAEQAELALLPGTRRRMLPEFYVLAIANDLFSQLAKGDTERAITAWRAVAERAERCLVQQGLPAPVRRAVVHDLCAAVRKEIEALRALDGPRPDGGSIIPFRPRTAGGAG